MRSDVTSIRSLPIDTPSGEKILLSDVASVEVKPTPNVIERDAHSRRIDIEANVTEGSLATVVAAMDEGLKNVELPPGFRTEVLGEYQERQEATSTLLTLATVALAVIYLLLQVAFSSWRLATLVILTLPIALVGGVFAAWLGGGVLSLGSIVGFLTVMGIAARNGILLINHCQHLEKYEGMKFGPELMLRGAGERLSPILMTTLATGLALVPLVVLGEIPGHEIEHPMATVILGGLVTSTLLNLFVVPSLYLRFVKPGGREHHVDKELQTTRHEPVRSRA